MQIKCNLCEQDREISLATLKKIKRGKLSGNCFKCRDFNGYKNPNHKYNIDDSLFEIIDSEEKAYLLGWIASDGSISKSSITIAIENDDLNLLKNLRDIVCKEIPIKNKINTNLVYFSIFSKKIIKDVCSLLKIKPGKKSSTVNSPDLNEELQRHFWRGYFDGDGSISKPGNTNYPKASVSSNSPYIRDALKKFANKNCSNSDKSNAVYWDGNGCLDFLALLYENCNIYLSRKYNIYVDWRTWVPSLSGSGTSGLNLQFRWVKTRKDAIPPTKKRITDSGYDLVILEKVQTIGDVEFYDTGIKIQPDYGWYFDVVPRSSISKTGYMMANSIGVIDRTYIGNILIPLRKIDKNMPDLELPMRIAQLIPRPIIHFEILEVENLQETDRGEGGFGSTGI